MRDDHGVSRRHVLGMAIAAGGFAVSGAVSLAFAQVLKRTPGEILGPFYPVLRSVEKTADLTSLPGKPGRAAGQVIYAMGRVVNVQGQQETDAEGRYRFKTVKPGAYPATANWMRPPHLHFEVTGKINRVITQMYFPGEPLNDKDLLLQNIRANKDSLIAKVLPLTADVEPSSLIVVWDIVLDKG